MSKRKEIVLDASKSNPFEGLSVLDLAKSKNYVGTFYKGKFHKGDEGRRLLKKLYAKAQSK